MNKSVSKKGFLSKINFFNMVGYQDNNSVNRIQIFIATVLLYTVLTIGIAFMGDHGLATEFGPSEFGLFPVLAGVTTLYYFIASLVIGGLMKFVMLRSKPTYQYCVKYSLLVAVLMNVFMVMLPLTYILVIQDEIIPLLITMVSASIITAYFVHKSAVSYLKRKYGALETRESEGDNSFNVEDLNTPDEEEKKVKIFNKDYNIAYAKFSFLVFAIMCGYLLPMYEMLIQSVS